MTALTAASFSQFVAANRFTVVHFWAVWNGYDIEMKRILTSEVPSELQSLISFATFDIDPPENHAICRHHDLLNVPFLAFYRDGSLVRTVTGLRKPHEIIGYLRELFV